MDILQSKLLATTFSDCIIEYIGQLERRNENHSVDLQNFQMTSQDKQKNDDLYLQNQNSSSDFQHLQSNQQQKIHCFQTKLNDFKESYSHDVQEFNSIIDNLQNKVANLEMTNKKLQAENENYQSIIHDFENSLSEANLNKCSKKKASLESSHLQKPYFELQAQYQALSDKFQKSQALQMNVVEN
jgi:predicted RNase H-like nuclease (RuvC/YqgF family)